MYQGLFQGASQSAVMQELSSRFGIGKSTGTGSGRAAFMMQHHAQEGLENTLLGMGPDVPSMAPAKAE